MCCNRPFGRSGSFLQTAVHCCRKYPDHDDSTGRVLLKVDYENAFNSVERDKVLEVVKDQFPGIYPFAYQSYASKSNLQYGDDVVDSARGVQQGDPLGPLLFSLAINHIIQKWRAELKIGYLDDLCIGGEANTVLDDFAMIIEWSREIGLHVKASKCEITFLDSSSSFKDEFLPSFEQLSPEIKVIDLEDLTLLGSPIRPHAGEKILNSKLDDLKRMMENLEQLDSHPALFLLRNALAIPKLTYLLRTSPTWRNMDILHSYDDVMRKGLETFLNNRYSDRNWEQATLPVAMGGLGIRKASSLALPAFLSSANATAFASNALLPTIMDYSYLEEAAQLWREKMGENAAQYYPQDVTVQENFDFPLCNNILTRLIDSSPSESERAILLAVSSEHSSEWLQAVPVSSLGLKLDDTSLKTAVGLRLSTKLCSHVFRCICGKAVDEFARHGLHCTLSRGRHKRHAEANNIIQRALATCDIPSKIEPTAMCEHDRKRPDGLTYFNYKAGKPLTWDFTTPCTIAPSNISDSIKGAGETANVHEKKKLHKYRELQKDYLVVPIAVETFGSFGQQGRKLIDEIGNMIIEKSGEKRSKFYLYQRISMAIQRGNVASVLGTVEQQEKLNEIFNLVT